MTTTGRPPHTYAAPAAAEAGEAGERRSPRGVQSVKFSFYRLRDEVRSAPEAERRALAGELARLIEGSASSMLTRIYSTVGTRADTDFLVWQVNDELAPIQDWHAELLGSPLAAALERPHSFLSMTMRSVYSNPLHDGIGGRDRLREDGGVADYLFVYPMVKTREWYKLPGEERQRIMAEHIQIGHRYHEIQINTSYSYGLDDQEFVVAFEGSDPGLFLALVRELRDSESSSYTERDTPMFTCRRLTSVEELAAQIGLVPADGAA